LNAFSPVALNFSHKAGRGSQAQGDSWDLREATSPSLPLRHAFQALPEVFRILETPNQGGIALDSSCGNDEASEPGIFMDGTTSRASR